MRSDGQGKRPWYRRLLRGCCCGLVVLSLPFILLGVWITLGYEDMEITPYHPFRSEEAKSHYLALYDGLAARWPVPSESWDVTTSYGQTHVRVSGNPAAPPLILLPGAGSNSLMWAPNVEELSRHFRVYAVDNVYDFGRSVYTRRIKDAAGFVEWLEELFDGLKLDRPLHLMGISYGGWISGEYLLRHPERLRKVVLLAPAATIVPFEPEFLGRALLCIIPHRAFIRGLIDWLAQDAMEKDEVTRRLVEEWVELSYQGLTSFKIKQLPPPAVFSRSQWGSIEVPTLFVVGENERIYSSQRAIERLGQVAPQIQHEVISGAGHDLSLVQAELVNQRVIEFLQSADLSEGHLD